MIRKELRDTLAEAYNEIGLFDNPSFDNSIIGISNDDKVVYDLNKMIKELAEDDGISEEEALEFIEYNTLRAIPYFGENAPIVVDSSLIDVLN